MLIMMVWRQMIHLTSLMTGDNLLIYANYDGMAADDTPNFFVTYWETINSRIPD